MTVTILPGDCRRVLATLPDAHFQTCVTSPPYFGLRDYGVDGQIGMEPTPDAFVEELVAVFRAVRRVLRDDGTLWLNLGDSYAGSWGAQSREHAGKHAPNVSALSANQVKAAAIRASGTGSLSRTPGLKPKDLMMIPARVALALQAPYYSGRITREADRVWLAAMLDGEGCFYIHRRLAGQHAGDGYYRQQDNYSAAFEVANTSEAIVQRCFDLTGVGAISRQEKDRRQPLFRWTVRSNEAKALIREIYPYLVAKQQQARIAFGVSSSGKDAGPAWQAIKLLHAGSMTDVDYPAPPSCHEHGWFLRSEIVWSKPNPMPESVTDRPTSAHEKVFLLSKSERYFYDAEAIREAEAVPNWDDGTRVFGGVNKHGANLAHGDRTTGRLAMPRKRGIPPRHEGYESSDQSGLDEVPRGTGRNARNVWTMATRPFKEAHFATFPPELPERCIKAGSRPGDHVLDPFGGAGTTGLVADRLQRHATLIELNPEYAAIAERRIAGDAPLLSELGGVA